MSEHFDVIIGTGAGGGTLLHRLAASPAWAGRILALERGTFLPREKGDWNHHGSERPDRAGSPQACRVQMEC